MKSTATKVALAAVMSVAATYAQSANLNAGDKLSITAGVRTEVVTKAGSYFTTTGSWSTLIQSVIQGGVIRSDDPFFLLSQGTDGIVIGASNTAPGAISSPSQISLFDPRPYSAFVTTAITGGTSGLDMSGWKLSFQDWDIPSNGVVTTYGNLGAGAWDPRNATSVGMVAGPYANGIAKFNWSGVYGTSYTLDYTATWLGNGPAQYALHLTGVVRPVPEASTYGMMLAGLGLVGAIVRRRKQAKI